MEIILLCGREGYSHRDVSKEFNGRHPGRQPITHSTVGRLLKKFTATGTVADLTRSGRPRTHETIQEAVIAKVYASPNKSIRRTSMELDVPRSTVHDILKKAKFHPYKLQLLQHLSEDDPDRRMQMCGWFLEKIEEEADFLSTVMFSDEANFYVTGEVNKQNLRYWSNENPHWYDPATQQGCDRAVVWCGMWNNHIIGPYFFEGNVDGEKYLLMLGDWLMPTLDLIGEHPTWFMQDGAPPHYATAVRHWLDETFPQHWIGRRGPVEWAPRSPDLNPLDFSFWGYLKSRVYSVKIRDVAHLRTRIEEECRAIDQNFGSRVLNNLKFRLQTCLEFDGGHIEQIL